MTAADIFIKEYIDENGISEIIFIDDLIKSFGEQFKSNNGCQWARKGSKLDKKYILRRYNAKEMDVVTERSNKIVAIQTLGFRGSIENHSIPQKVYSNLKDAPCVILGVKTSDMEIDHKNGKYDAIQYSEDDFQKMSKAANDAKREHCKKCNSTKQRFCASQLGYSIDFIFGDVDSPDCIGCYWYDPYLFNKTVSQFFKGE